MAFSPMSPPGAFRGWAEASPHRDKAEWTASPAPAPRREEPDLQTQLDQVRAEASEAVRTELEAELVQLREVVANLTPALQELETLRREALEAAAKDVTDLIRLFAQRVVHNALAMHPEALERLVMEAVSQLPEREEVTIAVSPHAAEALMRTLEPHLRERVVIDPELTQGARVRTRYASLDASLQTAMAGLDGALQDWLSDQWWAGGESV